MSTRPDSAPVDGTGQANRLKLVLQAGINVSMDGDRPVSRANTYISTYLKLREAAPIEGKRGAEGEQSAPKAPLAIHSNQRIVLQTGVNSEEQEEAMRKFLRAIADEEYSPAGYEKYVINLEKIKIYVGKGLQPGDIDEVSSFPEMIGRLRLYLIGPLPVDFIPSMLDQVY